MALRSRENLPSGEEGRKVFLPALPRALDAFETTTFPAREAVNALGRVANASQQEIPLSFCNLFIYQVLNAARCRHPQTCPPHPGFPMGFSMQVPALIPAENQRDRRIPAQTAAREQRRARL